MKSTSWAHECWRNGGSPRASFLHSDRGGVERSAGLQDRADTAISSREAFRDRWTIGPARNVILIREEPRPRSAAIDFSHSHNEDSVAEGVYLGCPIARGRAAMPADMSSGLPDERDFIVAKCPDIPMWSENLLFAVWDPRADLAMWLHLGTVPGKWTMWEDRVLVMLPGSGGALSLRGYHHTAPERRPAGPGLEFRQREPWRRWHASFDGFGLHTPEHEMLA